MSKHRCSQCDKELPPSWSENAHTNWDVVCPECAARDLKKKSLRRRRILDTSVRKKTGLEMMPQLATSDQQPAQYQAQAPAQPQTSTPPQTQPTAQLPGESSKRVPIPMDIELDTDDPMLLAGQQEAAEAEEKEKKTIDPMEETTQMRKPKIPPGPQVRLNF